MRNRHVGLLIVGMSALMGFIILLFNRAMATIVTQSCSHGSTCPMWGTIRLQTNISLALMVLVVLIGLYMIFFSKDEPELIKEFHKEVKVIKEQFNPKKLDKKHYEKIMSESDDEEKSVLRILLDNDGSLFQSKLVESTQLSKVKVTRILDRLEGKGIIERKRRGMTNIILLKDH